MQQTKKSCVRVDKKGEKERKREEGENRGGNGEREGERERERERERNGREKQKMEIFPAFRQSKLDGPRRKVDPRIAGYM